MHNMNGEEVNHLREMVSVMPRASVADRTLRTFVEIEAVFKRLSMEDTRKRALETRWKPSAAKWRRRKPWRRV